MSSRRLREGFVKPSRCLHEAFTQWARRGASAKGSRRLHERFMKTSRALKASRSLREGFAKASRRLQPYPRRLREGFAKAPRAPPFGNDSSDNDKPPFEKSLLRKVPGNCYNRLPTYSSPSAFPTIQQTGWFVQMSSDVCSSLLSLDGPYRQQIFPHLRRIATRPAIPDYNGFHSCRSTPLSG